MKFRFLSAASLAAAVHVAAPVHAFAMPLEQAMCPLEKLGEANAEALTVAFGSLEEAPSDAQMEKLGAAVNSCANENKWAEDDSKFALNFNVALLASLGLDAKLASLGVVATDYEDEIDAEGPQVWQKIVDDAANSPALKAAVDKLALDKGNKATDEMGGYLGAYLVSAAKMRLLAMKLADSGEVDF
jgi:hypothetical protein